MHGFSAPPDPKTTGGFDVWDFEARDPVALDAGLLHPGPVAELDAEPLGSRKAASQPAAAAVEGGGGRAGAGAGAGAAVAGGGLGGKGATGPVPRRRADKPTPSTYTFASASTKLGQIPQRKWTTPFDYAEARRLNALAVGGGAGAGTGNGNGNGNGEREKEKEKEKRKKALFGFLKREGVKG